jgi:hypothetical protein
MFVDADSVKFKGADRIGDKGGISDTLITDAFVEYVEEQQEKQVLEGSAKVPLFAIFGLYSTHSPYSADLNSDESVPKVN